MISDALPSISSALKKFKRDYGHRDYYWCTAAAPPILSKSTIQDILTNPGLIEINSFKVVTSGMYENFESNNDPLNQINRIKKAFDDGNTVVVKNLETYNLELDWVCKAIGNNVDAHMYISPKDASGFPMHTDDRTVFIFMQYGEKEFYVEDQKIVLEAGDMLYLKQGVKHKAIATQGSCHLSFGLATNTISELHESLPIPIQLPF